MKTQTQCSLDSHLSSAEGCNCYICGKLVRTYRVTRPSAYPRGVKGHRDLSERQSHFVTAVDSGEAQKAIRARLQDRDPQVVTEELDVQIWDGGERHGQVVA
jgi:hypothetical protein